MHTSKVLTSCVLFLSVASLYAMEITIFPPHTLLKPIEIRIMDMRPLAGASLLTVESEFPGTLLAKLAEEYSEKKHISVWEDTCAQRQAKNATQALNKILQHARHGLLWRAQIHLMQEAFKRVQAKTATEQDALHAAWYFDLDASDISLVEHYNHNYGATNWFSTKVDALLAEAPKHIKTIAAEQQSKERRAAYLTMWDHIHTLSKRSITDAKELNIDLNGRIVYNPVVPENPPVAQQ